MNKSSLAPTVAKLVLAAFLIWLAIFNLVVNLRAAADFVKPPDVWTRVFAVTLAFLSVAIPLVVAAFIISREYARYKSNKP